MPDSVKILVDSLLPPQLDVKFFDIKILNSSGVR